MTQDKTEDKTDIVEESTTAPQTQVGAWCRMTKTGKAVRISVDLEALESCTSYESADGAKEFVPLIVSVDALKALFENKRPVVAANNFL